METPVTKQQVCGRYGDTHHHSYLIFFDENIRNSLLCLIIKLSHIYSLRRDKYV
jgi:hypothetical protein